MTEPLRDPVLGELTRSDDFSHYVELAVDGRVVRLVLETGEGLTPLAVAQARTLARDPKGFAERARRAASEALHELHDETWSDGQPALGPRALEQRLSLESCEIAADGMATLYFADGGSFGGHSVLVYVAADGQIVDAKLAG